MSLVFKSHAEQRGENDCRGHLLNLNKLQRLEKNVYYQLLQVESFDYPIQLNEILGELGTITDVTLGIVTKDTERHLKVIWTSGVVSALLAIDTSAQELLSE